MSRRWLLVALLLVAAIPAAAQKPAEPPPANPENIEAALRLTLAAAAEYEIRVGTDEQEKPLELQREPVLKWSNPTQGEVHGNVFVWTRDGRPLVVGSLFKWFSPHTHMAHEFHSLAEEPLVAKFHSERVWKTDEAGLGFAEIPKAPAPAATEAQRLLQLKQLAKEFTGSKAPLTREMELRLLPQPIYRYAAPKVGIVQGALFAFVQGTDPEIFLLIEARWQKDEPVPAGVARPVPERPAQARPPAAGESPKKDAASATWQFAATRMNSTQEVRLRHRDRQVWSSEPLPQRKVFDEHKHPYTTFRFAEVPDFLQGALTTPKK